MLVLATLVDERKDATGESGGSVVVGGETRSDDIRRVAAVVRV